MCEYCGCIGYHPTACPNWQYTDNAVYRCASCGYPIYEGEGFYTIAGMRYHTDCILDMKIAELLSTIGYVEETA